MSTKIGHSDKNNSVEAIISRLKTALGVASDGELSEKFGYRRQAVNEWRKRNAVPLRTVFAICDQYREQWILTGEGPKLKSEQNSDSKERELCEQLGRMVLDAMKLALPHLLETGTNPEPGIEIPPPRQMAGPPPTTEQMDALHQSGEDSSLMRPR